MSHEDKVSMGMTQKDVDSLIAMAQGIYAAGLAWYLAMRVMRGLRRYRLREEREALLRILKERAKQ